MDFEFSVEQHALRESLQRQLNKRGRTPARGMLDGTLEHFDRETWTALAEMGALAAHIPEQDGGLGLSTLELCVLAEELGRTLAAAPALSTLFFASSALVQAPASAAPRAWLASIAAGERIVTWAQSDDLLFDGASLHGAVNAVLDGIVASAAVALARTQDGAPVSVFVALDGAGVTRSPQISVDPSRPLARLSFDAAPATLLDEGTGLWRSTRNRAAVLLAFEQIGGAQSALDAACAYARERIAFGRPIGAYQAVKHKLADIYVKIEIARVHAYYGAWALISAEPQVLEFAAASARVAAIEAETFAAQEALQTFGGLGYTWDSDCHLFYRRARLNALLLGPAHEWRALLGKALFQRDLMKEVHFAL